MKKTEKHKKIKHVHNPASSVIQNQNERIFNKNTLMLIGVLLVTFIVFSRSIGHEFLNWDDDLLIYDSPYVKTVAKYGIAGAIERIGIDFFQNNPISFISHAFTYRVWGKNPMPYHTINVIIHVLNTLLVFLFLRKLSKRSEVAIIATLLFALHPLRVESVAWATERKDVLYSFFYLAGLLSYLKYLESGKKIWFASTFLMFPLSSFSKFAGVTFPFALIIVDIYYRRGFVKKVVLEKVPFFVLLATAGIVEFSSQNAAMAVSSITMKYSFLDRLFFANYGLVFYTAKFFAPINLSALYPYPTKVGSALPTIYYIMPVFAVSILGIGAFLVMKFKEYRNELLFGFLFFLLNIFLVLHFVPFGGNIIVADRYTYLAHIGFCFIVAQLFVRFSDQKSSYAKPFLAIIVVAILTYTVATWKRVDIFKNSYTLFSDVIEKEPNAGVAYSNRGLTYEEKKDYAAALADYNRAIELIPTYMEARINRGNTKKALKDYQGAMEDFNFAITKINSKYPIAYNNRGNLKSDLGDFQGAIDDYTEAIKLKPDYPEPYHNRGLIKSKNFKLFTEAMPDFDMSISLKPDYKEAFNNRGVAKFESKDFEGCILDINKVIELDPENSLAYLIRGHAKLNLGRKNEACADWSVAARLGNPVATDMINQNCK